MKRRAFSQWPLKKSLNGRISQMQKISVTELLLIIINILNMILVVVMVMELTVVLKRICPFYFLYLAYIVIYDCHLKSLILKILSYNINNSVSTQNTKCSLLKY